MYDRDPVIRNLVALSPPTLPDTPPIAAFLRGLEPRLFPYAQISDGVLGPGDGTLPLRQILDALPASLPLSVEVPMPKTVRLPAREWARATAESTRRFLEDYYRGKQVTR